MSARTTTADFRSLYRRHYAFVWGRLRRLGVPERDAEDLLQDVFIVVHRRLGEFEGRATTSTWLHAITLRVYWNYARRQRHRPLLASESMSARPILDDSVGPERFAEHREASALLEELLGSLDPDKRTAYVLAELEGLSAPEIAKVTGAKTRTIYSRLRAAKQLVEASAKRVEARERNDVNVRRIARAASAPPSGLRRRAWAALLVRLPLGQATIATGLSLKVAAVALGLASLGAVAVVGTRDAPKRSDPLRAMTPRQFPMPDDPVALAAAPSVPSVGSTGAPVPARTPAAAPRPPRTRAPRPESRREADSDLALLQQSRTALKNDRPADALELLARHRELHPDSPLARERDRTRILALCALGRNEESASLADACGLPRACGR